MIETKDNWKNSFERYEWILFGRDPFCWECHTTRTQEERREMQVFYDLLGKLASSKWSEEEVEEDNEMIANYLEYIEKEAKMEVLNEKKQQSYWGFKNIS